MTLILSFTTRRDVIQVVDRLVSMSKRTDKKLRPFDPQSNKTLVYAARDAVVVISYTGLAYLDNMPTDQWIAQTLIDRPLAIRSDGRPGAIQLVYQKVWPFFGTAVKRLSDAISGTMQKLRPVDSQSVTLKLVLAGWQLYRSKRPRPIMLTIVWQPGRASCHVDPMPRFLGRRAYLQIEPDGFLTKDEQQALLRSFQGRDALGIENGMVSALRLVAARSTGVSPDCICIMLPHPSLGWARIRYDSPVPQRRSLVSSAQSINIPIAFTPWIITQGGVLAPSIVSGPCATETPVGPYRLRIEGTGPRTDPSQPLALQESQQRPTRPKR